MVLRCVGLFMVGVGLFAPASYADPPLFEHRLWDRVLHEHVSPDGLVDYASLKRQPEELVAYVDSIAERSPDSSPEMFPTEAHRLAYWINAYNALVVVRVVRNYPLKSMKDLGGIFKSVFGKKQMVGGQMLSYDDIEHRIIRERFHEPRIHFVLNCASRSCAPLGAEALTAINLERLLDDSARQFVNSPKNVVIHPEKGVVELSKYFDWFAHDFERWVERETGEAGARALDYVEHFLEPKKLKELKQRQRWKIRFLRYDWSLNDTHG